MNDVKIAWRNLWRNPRRSLITMASVFFGVILSTLMTSMQYGSYDAMIANVVKFYSGYIQIFTKEYHEKKSINNSFELTDSLLSAVNGTPEITSFTSRLESYALASSEELTKGTAVIGIDPVGENKVTGIKKWVDKGKFLTNEDNGVLVAIGLANYLHIGVGDTLVLYGQGYHGVTAASLFPVRGIMKFPLPELNKQMVYMDLKACQKFYGAKNHVTTLVLMVKDHYYLPAAIRHLDSKIHKPFIAMTWDELQPELVQMINADRAGGVFTKAILYMVIAFGVFGTIMMLMSERTREIGVTIAIGMQRSKLAVILFFETVMIGILGAFMGIVGSIPLISYFYNNPVKLTGDAGQTMVNMGLEPYFYFSWKPFVFYNQAITVLVITIVIAAYPVYKAFKLRVSEALRA